MVKTMLTIAICEDEEYILEKLCKKTEKYIKKKHLNANVRTFLSGEELLKENIAFDIVLLDLKLPGMNGMEVAKQLTHNSRIIFITSYGEYALAAFDVNAVHYLLKPVTEERLSLALDRAFERLEQGNDNVFALVKAGKTQIIPIQDILYCEVFNHQVCIHTAQNTYNYSKTLDMLEKELDECFFRCHRSFLVNMSSVVGQEKGMVMLSNGDRILLSRRKQSEFMERLLKFLKKEVIV